MPENLPEAARARLRPGEVLLSYHLGTRESWIWALDRQGLEVYLLPDRAAVEELAQKAAAAIRGGQLDATPLSLEVYRTLSGCLGERFWTAPRWYLSLNGRFGRTAHRSPRGKAGGGAPEYLLARHTVQQIPGAAYWLGSDEGPAPQLSPLFVGLRDAIYSPRRPAFVRPSRPDSEELALAPLPGSAAEIETCSGAWRGRSILLRGHDANPREARPNPVQHPAAVHYLESAGATAMVGSP